MLSLAGVLADCSLEVGLQVLELHLQPGASVLGLSENISQIH